MKKLTVTFVFVFSMMIALYLPASAKDTNSTSTIVSTKLSAASGGVRYIKVRGKRYKVWYNTFRKRGKLYYKITKIRRA